MVVGWYLGEVVWVEINGVCNLYVVLVCGWLIIESYFIDMLGIYGNFVVLFVMFVMCVVLGWRYYNIG